MDLENDESIGQTRMFTLHVCHYIRSGSDDGDGDDIGQSSRLDSWVYDLRDLFSEEFQNSRDHVSLIYFIISFFCDFSWLDGERPKPTWISLLRKHVPGCTPGSFLETLVIRLVAITRNDMQLLVWHELHMDAHPEVQDLVPTWHDAVPNHLADHNGNLDRAELQKCIGFLCSLGHRSLTTFDESNCPTEITKSPSFDLFRAVFALSSNHPKLIKRSIDKIAKLFDLTESSSQMQLYDIILALMGDTHGVVAFGKVLSGGNLLQPAVLSLFNIRNERNLSSAYYLRLLAEACEFMGWDQSKVISIVRVCQFRIASLPDLLGQDSHRSQIDSSAIYDGIQSALETADPQQEAKLSKALTRYTSAAPGVPKNRTKARLAAYLDHTVHALVIVALILADIIAGFATTDAVAANIVSLVIILLFEIEIIARVYAFGWRELFSFLEIVDASIIQVSLVLAIYELLTQTDDIAGVLLVRLFVRAVKFVRIGVRGLSAVKHVHKAEDPLLVAALRRQQHLVHSQVITGLYSIAPGSGAPTEAGIDLLLGAMDSIFHQYGPTLKAAMARALKLQSSNEGFEQLVGAKFACLLQPTAKLESPGVLRRTLLEVTGTLLKLFRAKYSKVVARRRKFNKSQDKEYACIVDLILGVVNVDAEQVARSIHACNLLFSGPTTFGLPVFVALIKGQTDLLDKAINDPFDTGAHFSYHLKEMVARLFNYTPDHESADCVNLHQAHLLVRLAGGRAFLSGLMGARTLESFSKSTQPNAPTPRDEQVGHAHAMLMLLNGTLKSRGFFRNIFGKFADALYVKIVELKFLKALEKESSIQQEEASPQGRGPVSEEENQVLPVLIEAFFDVMRGSCILPDCGLRLLTLYADLCCNSGVHKTTGAKEAKAKLPSIEGGVGSSPCSFFDLLAILSGSQRQRHGRAYELKGWIHMLCQDVIETSKFKYIENIVQELGISDAPHGPVGDMSSISKNLPPLSLNELDQQESIVFTIPAANNTNNGMLSSQTKVSSSGISTHFNIPGSVNSAQSNGTREEQSSVRKSSTKKKNMTRDDTRHAAKKYINQKSAHGREPTGKEETDQYYKAFLQSAKAKSEWIIRLLPPEALPSLPDGLDAKKLLSDALSIPVSDSFISKIKLKHFTERFCSVGVRDEAPRSGTIKFADILQEKGGPESSVSRIVALTNQIFIDQQESSGDLNSHEWRLVRAVSSIVNRKGKVGRSDAQIIVRQLLPFDSTSLSHQEEAAIVDCLMGFYNHNRELWISGIKQWLECFMEAFGGSKQSCEILESIIEGDFQHHLQLLLQDPLEFNQVVEARKLLLLQQTSDEEGVLDCTFEDQLFDIVKLLAKYIPVTKVV